MVTILQVYGPFPVPFQANKGARQITKDGIKEFWKSIQEPGLSEKQGCYVFGIQAGKGFTPWYVGKTGKAFINECFQPQKMVKYYDALATGKKGTPIMFLVAPVGNKKTVEKRDLKDIETFLIQSAKQKNARLLNSHKAGIPDWNIEGVIRGKQGQPSKAAQTFKKMLNL